MIRNGRDETHPHRQRYLCKACHERFGDLTNTVLAGHHQPLRVWVLCLYLMGLNLSNLQIAAELDLAASDGNCSPPFPKDQAATGMIGLPTRAFVMACSAVRPCRRPVAITEAAAA